MKITADTNVLLRVAIRDDLPQARVADALLREADVIAVPIPVLCEFVWVLRKNYGLDRAEIVGALRQLLEISVLRVDRVAVQAGIASLEGGGNFADACIAVESRRMGGAVFASFDRRAVALVKAAGGEAHLLNPAAAGL